MRIPLAVKSLGIVCVMFSVIGGLLIDVPSLDILNETIRNLFYHVTAWFAMISLYLGSFIYSIKYLRSGDERDDTLAKVFVQIGIVFGVAGMLTGMLWARFTWGAFWVPDPKLNGAAIAMLAYFAYLILRNSFTDPLQRAKISSVYNIFAFVMMILFVFILPRMTDSLHPGNGGNPAFSGYDLDNTMRLIFYPAVIGWIIIGMWITEIRFRMDVLKKPEL